jgi:hypothetical protein
VRSSSKAIYLDGATSGGQYRHHEKKKEEEEGEKEAQEG